MSYAEPEKEVVLRRKVSEWSCDRCHLATTFDPEFGDHVPPDGWMILAAINRQQPTRNRDQIHFCAKCAPDVVRDAKGQR